MKTVWLHLLCYAMAANLIPSGSLLANDPSPPAIDLQTIARVFQETHDGWSVDEVLLDDDRRRKLVEALRQSTDDRDQVEIDEKNHLRVANQTSKVRQAASQDDSDIQERS